MDDRARKAIDKAVQAMASHEAEQVERAVRGLGIDESHADLFVRVTHQGSDWTELHEHTGRQIGDFCDTVPLLRWRWTREDLEARFEMEMHADTPREVARILRRE